MIFISASLTEKTWSSIISSNIFCTVLGVVARPDGTFLITKRVMTKAWAPGWWEVSGGAAQAGEESYEAVLREVKEETGLDARNAEGGYLLRIRERTRVKETTIL